MKKVKRIKQNLIERNFSLMKYVLKTSTTVFKNKDNPQKIIEEIVGLNPEKFISELSHYKGSITKAGQLLSQYGEYYLPEHINKKLRLLQTSTHYLDFERIQSQIDQKILRDFTIHPDAIAAASIGQVHKAIHNESQKTYALKIQYRGIQKAINADMFFIKMLFKSINLVPKGFDLEDVFNEIQRVLILEMNYKREALVINQYKNYLRDSFYYVPQVNLDYSTEKVLCLEFLEGSHLNETNFKDQETRNLFGAKIFELFLKELFEFNLIQSDAHGGNYLISQCQNKLNLLDFGACLEFDPLITKFYQDFLLTSFYDDRVGFFKRFNEFILFSKKSLEYDQDLMWKYIQLATSSLKEDEYSWHESDLPDRLFTLGKELQKTFKFNSVPHHFIFIDRKVLGVFTLLSNLKAKFNVKSIFERVAKLS